MDLRQTAVLMVVVGDLLVCVRSQAVCGSGWFGSLCQYKCRCSDSNCTTEGACRPGVLCQGGWFGPACQYADLAYSRSSAWETTDGDDQTCLGAFTPKQVTVTLDHRYHVTWLRVRLSKPDLLYNLTVRFRRDASLSCTNTRTARVDNTTLDIYCELKETVKHVILSGKGVQYLCSVYISGDRNVALKQNTSQSSTYSEHGLRSYPSQKAVDGNSDPVFFRGNTCSHTLPGDSNPNLNISFSTLQRVTRYVLHNRDEGYSFRLQGFELRSYGPSMAPMFNHTDRSQQPQQVYTVVPDQVTPPIRLVNVAVNNRDKILILCELEVYGDSACQPGQYGWECKHTCHCAGNQSCFVSTGGCPSGCPAGFTGQDCRTGCDVGSYGPGCQLSCSQFCVRDGDPGTHFCDHTNGTCLHGCQSGYLGSTCSDISDDGSPAGPDNGQLIGIVVGCLLGVIIVAVIIAAGIIVFRRCQTTSHSPAESRDNISLSRNDPSTVHRTLPNGEYEIPEVSKAETQRAPGMGSQGKVESEDIVGDDCVVQSCDDSVAHTYEEIVAHSYDESVAHTYDSSLAHTYEKIDDNLASSHEDVVDDSNKDITPIQNSAEYANIL